MAEKLMVLDPTTEPEKAAVSMAPRLASLDGKVVGLIDNSKPNSDRILDMVANILGKKYKLAGVVKRRKPGAGRGATKEMLDELARETQFVIAGVGD